jgi:glycosyltransferase involved in cell wall biosynthesis
MTDTLYRNSVKHLDVLRSRLALRVLMVAPQPFFRARGTPFSVLHRIRALVQSGHRVDHLTYPFGEDIDLPGLRIFRTARPAFVRDVKIGPSFAKLLLDVPLYFATVKALRSGDYDVLHSHEEAAFFGMRLARKYGVRHVYDMHSSLPNQLRNFGAYDFAAIRVIFQWLENRVLRTSDGVITICAELADIATRQCRPDTHVMIENTADDSKVFGRSNEDVRLILGLQGKRIILYTGTFEPYQGLNILLKGFSRVREKHADAHLVMVGGTPGQIEGYGRLAQSLGIGHAVTLVGTVHPSRIPGFLKAADVIVSPRSHGKYTPLKIYNYMRSHRPLVATDLYTHTQTLDSNVALLVPPNEEGMALGIERILTDGVLGRRLAQAAAERVERKFSDEAYISKVASFYEQLAQASPQRQACLPESAAR